jgi:hypothetical protein
MPGFINKCFINTKIPCLVIMHQKNSLNIKKLKFFRLNASKSFRNMAYMQLRTFEEYRNGYITTEATERKSQRSTKSNKA